MTKTTLHLLVVEDQDAIAANIADYFEGKGHSVDFAYTGPQGLELALTHIYDLLILDVMLPGMDGLDVCREIRRRSPRHVPILMLTARDSLPDKIQGFEKGADDYVTKPFALEELEMRALALTRRHLLLTDHIVNLGDLCVDRQQKTIHRQGKRLDLNPVGYQIVEALAEAHPRVVTRSELIQKIWGDAPTESDALRSHIYQLRMVVDKPFGQTMVKTVHGAGFCLEFDDEE